MEGLNKTLLELVISNDYEYNLRKSVEELLELATVLSQRMNKVPPYGPKDQDIIDEIGDVKIRLMILEHLFGIELVQARVDKKLKKFQKLINEKLFIGTI